MTHCANFETAIDKIKEKRLADLNEEELRAIAKLKNCNDFLQDENNPELTLLAEKNMKRGESRQEMMTAKSPDS